MLEEWILSTDRLGHQHLSVLFIYINKSEGDRKILTRQDNKEEAGLMKIIYKLWLIDQSKKKENLHDMYVSLYVEKFNVNLQQNGKMGPGSAGWEEVW